MIKSERKDDIFEINKEIELKEIQVLDIVTDSM